MNYKKKYQLKAKARALFKRFRHYFIAAAIVSAIPLTALTITWVASTIINLSAEAIIGLGFASIFVSATAGLAQLFKEHQD